MSKIAQPLTCSSETKEILSCIANSRTAPFSEVQKAKIILFCLQGVPLAHIAKQLCIGLTTVTRWRNRFLEAGIKGLGDLQHNGRPAIYKHEFRERVLKLLESPPPEG